MTATVTPTSDNRGLIPAGSFIPGWGTVLETSVTAYKVRGVQSTTWVSFDTIHGRPAPATPLVTFGGAS